MSFDVASDSAARTAVILPGATLGLLGGGQLGRMFIIAARTLGYRVTVLEPDPHSPAAEFATGHLNTAYTDPASLAELARTCAAVTTEFENAPADALDGLSGKTVVRPGGESGEVAVFPVAENRHARGILDLTLAPARVSPPLAAEAAALASRLAAELQYVGVLAVEMFVVGGRLLLNEIAPRPHNSGHYTIDACRTSQFEQQVRVLCGLPLGDPSQHTPAVMVNLLGDSWGSREAS